MTDPDRLAHTARVLSAHGLTLPEHYVMCSAGYRVTRSQSRKATLVVTRRAQSWRRPSGGFRDVG